jgi:hypothetical protein
LWADAPIVAALVDTIVPQMVGIFHGSIGGWAIDRRCPTINYLVEAFSRILSVE